jgi:hypothetical protein
MIEEYEFDDDMTKSSNGLHTHIDSLSADGFWRSFFGHSVRDGNVI